MHHKSPLESPLESWFEFQMNSPAPRVHTFPLLCWTSSPPLLLCFPSSRPHELFPSFSFSSLSLSLSPLLSVSLLGHFPAFFQSPSIIPPSKPVVSTSTELGSERARAHIYTRTHARAAAAFLQSPLSVYPSLLFRRRACARVCLRVCVCACMCFWGSASDCLPILPRQQQRTSPGGRPES